MPEVRVELWVDIWCVFDVQRAGDVVRRIDTLPLMHELCGHCHVRCDDDVQCVRTWVLLWQSAMPCMRYKLRDVFWDEHYMHQLQDRLCVEQWQLQLLRNGILSERIFSACVHNLFRVVHWRMCDVHGLCLHTVRHGLRSLRRELHRLLCHAGVGRTDALPHMHALLEQLQLDI